MIFALVQNLRTVVSAGSKWCSKCLLGLMAKRTAGLNTIQQSANVSLASTSLATVETDRQSAPEQTRPGQTTARADSQTARETVSRAKLRASRPHPHTSLFLCRPWWYDLNDNGRRLQIVEQSDSVGEGDAGWMAQRTWHDIQRFGGVSAQLESSTTNPKGNFKKLDASQRVASIDSGPKTERAERIGHHVLGID